MVSESSSRLSSAYHYISHLISAGNEHDVHSPFVYKLLTEAIYENSNVPGFQKIESFRKHLLTDTREISVTDLGAGSSFDGKLKKRSIRDITKKFAKSPKHCRFLYRLTSFFQPMVMIELGTSLGISAMYQAAGNPGGKLFTLEGCPETAKVARENFDKNNFTNITCITGNFDDTLLALLNEVRKADYVYIDGNHTYEATTRYFKILKNHIHQNSVLVFDDIYWSGGMQKAWKEILSDPEVTISLDFYQFGVVFFNRDFSIQHFKLRL